MYFVIFTTVFVFSSFGTLQVLPINFPLKLFKNTNITAAASSTYNLLFVTAITIISIQQKRSIYINLNPSPDGPSGRAVLRRRFAVASLLRLKGSNAIVCMEVCLL